MHVNKKTTSQSGSLNWKSDCQDRFWHTKLIITEWEVWNAFVCNTASVGWNSAVFQGFPIEACSKIFLYIFILRLQLQPLWPVCAQL